MNGRQIILNLVTGAFCVIALAVVVSRQNRSGGSALARSETRSLPPLLKSKCLRPFTLQETEQGRASTAYTFAARGQVVKIEVIQGVEQETAQALLKDGIMGLEALYANALSPYPGDISNTVVADARFRPKFFRKDINGKVYSYYLLFANERMGYGATTADSIKFKSLVGWIYCEASRDFCKVRYFVSLEEDSQDLERFFLALTCP